jgi:hypothetical protein
MVSPFLTANSSAPVAPETTTLATAKQAVIKIRLYDI